MPEQSHNGSRTRPVGGSLLRAAGTVRVVNGYAAADASVNEICAQMFVAGVERDGLRHVRSVEIERASHTFAGLEDHGRVELSWRTSEGEDAVISLPGGELALLVGWQGGCEIVVAGRNQAGVRRASGKLARALRQKARRTDEFVVRFWSAERNRGRRRRLEAPSWAEIAPDYPAAVRRSLAQLLRARGPEHGSVLLWYGAPGTGKTYALRALARSWRRWCRLHYVTDPEQFLADPDYMLRVATSSDDDDSKWRLIVLEDA